MAENRHDVKDWSTIFLYALGTLLFAIVAFDFTRVYGLIDAQTKAAMDTRSELNKVTWEIIRAFNAIDNLERRSAALEKEVRDIRERGIYEKGRRGEH